MSTKENTKENTKTAYNEGDARVIDMKDYAEYHAKLSEIVEQVDDLAEEFYDSLFELAVLDKWKHWSDSQPIGAELYVDEDMLRNTGDKNIDVLWELLDKMTDVKKSIKVNPPRKSVSENPFEID